MRIDEIEFEDHPSSPGERAVVKFPNGYSASIIQGGPFYTTDGTYEIAVIDPQNAITYTTPITDDVLGYLTEGEANQALSDIEALPKEEVEDE